MSTDRKKCGQLVDMTKGNFDVLVTSDSKIEDLFPDSPIYFNVIALLLGLIQINMGVV